MVLFFEIALSVSIDCANMINLGLGLRVDVHQPGLMSELRFECCTATGVSCDANRVTVIDWNSKNLDGYINGTALPSSLLELHLWKNSLYGTIPTLLPEGLQNLDIDGNKLVGDVPILPSTVTILWLGSNGAIGNRLTGTVILNRPRTVYIVDNWITDIIIADISDIVPSSCDLSSNPLLGNPKLKNLTMCSQNNLYSAGSLPRTLSTTYTTKVAIRSSSLNKISTTSKVTISTSFKNSLSQLIVKTSISNRSTMGSIPNLPTVFEFASYTPASELILSYTSFEDSITNSFTSFNNFSTSTILDGATDMQDSSLSPVLVYALMGGLVVLCMLVLFASLIFKHPEIHSKFGRKNSFGTLNPVNTTKTQNSK